MTKELTELRSCPFCGGINAIEIGPEDVTRDVFCPTCQATVFWPSGAKRESVAAWNKRASSLEVEAVVEAAIEYRDDAGFHHHWNCNGGIPEIGTRPCDCGSDKLYKALAALSAIRGEL